MTVSPHNNENVSSVGKQYDYQYKRIYNLRLNFRS